MAFQHGVSVQQIPTSLRPPRQVDSALPFVVGTAPVQALSGDKPINEPLLVTDFQDFVTRFGAVPDGAAETDYSLSLFARIYFATYGAAPAVMVNVYDPDDAHATNGLADVVAADIIGGVGGDGARTGLELIEEVFPRFGKVPQLVCAPGFADQPTVAVALVAKTTINGLFKARCLVDVPDTEATVAAVNAWKGANAASARAFVCWPSVKVGDDVHPLSAHVAGLIAQTDATRGGGMPYVSPSNKRLQITDAAQLLTHGEANLLNQNGVACPFRFGTGGIKLWGNRTGGYPDSTDPVDSLLPIGRMVDHVSNTLILSTWQRVDDPMNLRQVEAVANSTTVYIAGLVGQGALVGGRVEVLTGDNPATSLVDGKITYRVYLAPPPPLESISFFVEYAPDYLASLVS